MTELANNKQHDMHGLAIAISYRGEMTMHCLQYTREGDNLRLPGFMNIYSAD